MPKIKPPTLTPEQEFLVRLEMERNDKSYLQPRKPIEPKVVYLTQKEYPKSRAVRDKMMFDAGRYAAGARDKSATKAAKALQKELDNEDR